MPRDFVRVFVLFSASAFLCVHTGTHAHTPHTNPHTRAFSVLLAGEVQKVLDPWTLLECVNTTPIARFAVDQSQFVSEMFWEDVHV